MERVTADAARGARKPSFGFEETRDSDGTTRIALTGELDFATAPAFRDRLGELGRAKRDVLVDLSELAFVDSSGLAVLIVAQTDANQDGWSLALTTPTPYTRRYLERTGVFRIFRWR